VAEAMLILPARPAAVQARDSAKTSPRPRELEVAT
jgi:hypothetical protein